MKKQQYYFLFTTIDAGLSIASFFGISDICREAKFLVDQALKELHKENCDFNKLKVIHDLINSFVEEQKSIEDGKA